MAEIKRVRTEEGILEEEVKRHILIVPYDKFIGMLDKVANWGRRSSIWPLQFGLACCAIEMICTAASRFDIARFGAELFRASPRQADLMIVSGTVTKKMVPIIVRLWNQMPEPKYVISMGACATAGGPFKEGYNVVSGIDEFLPVDVYVPGCPPTPQALLNALITLQKKIDQESIKRAPWYKKTDKREVPVPVLGPDIVDVRQVGEISEKARQGVERPAPKVLPKMKPAPTHTPVELAPGATVVVEKDKLLEVAQKAKNELGFDYLANLTSVDYSDCYEVVYHLYSTKKLLTPTLSPEGRGSTLPLTLKVRASKEKPVVPSLVPLYQGADFQEREVWDLMGIRFEGHPNLKRILMWEGFEGHPLRKGYLEPYYEEPGKIFSSRWRAGVHQRAEERNPWGRNVVYPKGFDPAKWAPPQEESAGAAASQATLERIDEETLIVNLGPQHPSTHGVFRLKVILEGERIAHLEPIMGYMHRNHEKIGERNTYLMNFPYTDRLDYITSMANNLAYALTVEKLMGVKPPERAEYIRVIMAELTRIQNHFWAIGFLLNDLGAFFTPALYAIEERELILDLFEMASGSRMMCNYMRFGGLANDVPPEFMPQLKVAVKDRIPRAIDEMDRYLTTNEILLQRCIGVGVLPAEEAINFSAAGPVLRASGVKYDVRRAEPYSIYDRFDFEIPTFPNGDVYDRYRQRIAEMRQSMRILEQTIKQIPESGEILAGRKAWSQRVPEGEAYGRAENPKGELGFYIVSDGSSQAYRYHVRAPSFINLTPLARMCKGHLVADVVAILGSIDIVLGETDR